MKPCKCLITKEKRYFQNFVLCGYAAGRILARFFAGYFVESWSL